MTNEEKAYEISQSPLIEDGIWHYATAEIAALEMAEWKDKQYAEIIKDEYNNSYESGLCEGRRMAEKQFKEYLEEKKENMIRKWGHLVVAEVSTINIIISELFPNDKAHN